MNPNDQAIAQLLAMSQPQQQQPLLKAGPKYGAQAPAPIADPMQGMAQVAQSAAGAFKDGRMMGKQNGFPTAPLNTGAMGMAPGGVFGLLSNPFATYSRGGGLY